MAAMRTRGPARVPDSAQAQENTSLSKRIRLYAPIFTPNGEETLSKGPAERHLGLCHNPLFLKGDPDVDYC